MSDYATRLRDLADTLDSCQWEHPLCSADLCREVAGELERLEDEVAYWKRRTADG